MITTQKKTKNDLVNSTISIHWLYPKDISHILWMEKNAYETPSLLPEIIKELTQSGRAGKVIKVNGEIAGFLIYSFSKKHIDILSLVIVKQYRRLGLGSILLQEILIDGVKTVIAVNEDQFEQQLFLQSNGFICDAIIDENDSNYYWMIYDGNGIFP